jgi:hypothetical protein
MVGVPKKGKKTMDKTFVQLLSTNNNYLKQI